MSSASCEGPVAVGDVEEPEEEDDDTTMLVMSESGFFSFVIGEAEEEEEGELALLQFMVELFFCW